ncbi:30S ribosomal protein s12 [Plakobranchus ocellatus]|uniref:Small ribosomal subunit protein uS12m n=1 Tax=Plakobranchus ocellatus TaxID=259542 RepID=A0AAV4CU73_9GAST|nr:30S ribosomal protein s12 [Plakobranchus ocellatus]
MTLFGLTGQAGGFLAQMLSKTVKPATMISCLRTPLHPASPPVVQQRFCSRCLTVLNPVTQSFNLWRPILKAFAPQETVKVPSRSITLEYMHRTGKYQKVRRKKNSPLEGRPQLRGVVLKTLIKKPKKPNSANRKCVRLRLSTGREVTAYVPGEGHNLQEHNVVLVQGGKLQDTPGVKLVCVRGKYDLPHVKKK